MIKVIKNIHFWCQQYWPLILIGIIALLTQGLPLLSSYWKDAQGNLYLTSVHDSTWHLSLINELTRQFPPEHPGYAGEMLQNYHYLADIIFVCIKVITGLPTWFVYYRVAVVLAVIGFVWSSFYLSSLLTKTKRGAYLATILVLFGSSFAYVAKLIGWSQHPSANVFMLDQPYDMLTNVHTYFGFSLFLFSIAWAIKGLRKNNLKYLVIASIGMGVLYGFKAYGSLVGLLGLGITGTVIFLRSRQLKSLLSMTIPGGIVGFGLYALTSQGGNGLLPAFGWLLTKMVTDQDRLSGLYWLNARREAYQVDGKLVHLSVTYAVMTFVYLVGALGIRVIGFGWALSKIRSLKKLKNEDIYLITTMVVSLVLPLIVVQTTSTYNTVQFGQYGLLIAAIYTAMWWEKNVHSVLIAIGLVGLAIPTTFHSLAQSTNFADRTVVLSPAEQDAFEFLRTQTSRDTIILTPIESKHTGFMFIPGFTSRRSYYSGEVIVDQIGYDATQRIDDAEKFWNNSTNEQRLQFLDKYGIDYIYVDTNETSLELYSISSPEIISVFSQDHIQIFKVTTSE